MADGQTLVPARKKSRDIWPNRGAESEITRADRSGKVGSPLPKTLRFTDIRASPWCLTGYFGSRSRSMNIGTHKNRWHPSESYRHTPRVSLFAGRCGQGGHMPHIDQQHADSGGSGRPSTAQLVGSTL